MICPICREQGLKSRVTDHGSSRTLMGGNETFWDEEGNYHFHAINKTTTSYSCSNGHNFYTKGYQPCPMGDFGGYEIKTRENLYDGS